MYLQMYNECEFVIAYYDDVVLVANVRLVKQESCAIAKMTAKCALYMGALEIFGTP